MLKYLVPRITLGDLKSMLVVALIGGLIAGVYGVLHDQITYSICPEYFTNLKFEQFHYVDFDFGDRAFVASIGFLASWWVGFIIAWFLSRKFIPGRPRKVAYQGIIRGFIIVFASGILAGVAGYLYGLWRGPDADYSSWLSIIDRYQIADKWAFVRVAYIHNASYLGGVAGLIISLKVIRPKKSDSTEINST